MNMTDHIERTFAYRVLFDRIIEPGKVVPESKDVAYELKAETTDEAIAILNDIYRADGDTSWTAWILYVETTSEKYEKDVDVEGYMTLVTTIRRTNRVEHTHRRSAEDFNTYWGDLQKVEEVKPVVPKPGQHLGKLEAERISIM